MNATPRIEQAEDELNAAKVLSSANHHSQAIWLAGQAVEKAHKAILFALGLRVGEKQLKSQFSHRIKDVAELLPLALHVPSDPSIATALATLQARMDDSRYPSLAQTGSPSALVAPRARLTSSAQDISDAERLVQWCKERIARATKAVTAMSP